MFDLRTAIVRDVFNTLIEAEGESFLTLDRLRSLAMTAVNAGKALEAAIAEYDPLVDEQRRKDQQTADAIRQQPAPTEDPQPQPQEPTP